MIALAGGLATNLTYQTFHGLLLSWFFFPIVLVRFSIWLVSSSRFLLSNRSPKILCSQSLCHRAAIHQRSRAQSRADHQAHTRLPVILFSKETAGDLFRTNETKNETSKRVYPCNKNSRLPPNAFLDFSSLPKSCIKETLVILRHSIFK